MNITTNNTQAKAAKTTYSVQEIADMLEISMPTAYKLVNEGSFKSFKIGSAIRVLKSSFDAWLTA